MQPLQNCIGPNICIGRGSWCLPYAGILNPGFFTLYTTYTTLHLGYGFLYSYSFGYNFACSCSFGFSFALSYGFC